jgi:glycosyltransferase involved in cell wall biosynthesis
VRLAFLSIGRHIHTERWIRWFAERGDECHLLTVQPGELPGVHVHDIRSGFGPKPLRYLFALRIVRKILSEIRPDLLNTHFLTGYGYWGHYSGMHPNVLTVWGDDVYVTPFESSLKNRLARAALGSCDALTGDSTDILDVAAGLGADPARSFRVLWGVDFEIFRPRPDHAWRERLGLAADDLVFFSPRSYTQPYYNIDVIIAAATRLKSEVPRARFVFSGYEGDPAPFEARVREAGLDDVTRVVGRIPHAEFAEALAGSDVVMTVPSVDATAVSLLEAMACGSAIICSDLPSSVEWIRHGESGLVTPPRDEDALLEAMRAYAADPGLRGAHGRKARDDVHRVAGFEQNMQLVAEIFDRALERRGARWPEGVSLQALKGGAS